MSESNAPKGVSGNPIYTLGQTRTASTPKTAKIVIGRGSDLTDGLTAEGRGKRKFLGFSLALSCVDIAKQKKNKAMEKTFWNVFHCQRKITTVNGIVYGKYCGNRSCMVCMSIRKGKMINTYYPILSQWEQPYFVTLTVKSCPAKRLPLMMDKMVRGFQLIHDKQRKRHKRGKGIRLVGVKSLECNFNPERHTYNPHFHLIVETKEMAELLVDEWLKLWTPKFAGRKAQDIRPVYDLTTNLIEIIKYGSKVFTEPDLKKTKQRNPKIYAKALYNILCAMKGHRLFDRFGFNNPNPKQKPVGAKVVVDFEQWTYSLTKLDWINAQTGEALTHYAPPPELIDLLLNQMDSETE